MRTYKTRDDLITAVEQYLKAGILFTVDFKKMTTSVIT